MQFRNPMCLLLALGGSSALAMPAAGTIPPTGAAPTTGTIPPTGTAVPTAGAVPTAVGDGLDARGDLVIEKRARLLS
ncbi:hypothetical protein PGQ11_014662 [Apiospora arundinis]|uniref:Uncharacterized protein n=1 Tax=Apiospora arundinis TaxID=335852 RepID=A0ABR2HSX4_9PEZI